MMMLCIRHVITRDDSITADPVVPGYGDESFGLVRRLPDQRSSLWRTISLETHANETPPASRDLLGGTTKDNKL
jgi:hypothetical protein